MKYTDFHESQFRHSVNQAMQSVDRILHTDRHPRLAGDVDHTYGNKYELANLLTNTAVIAQMNVLERMGLNVDKLKEVAAQVKSSKRSATLRFEASEKCEFLMEQRVEVPSDKSVETKETMESTSSIFGSSTKSTITRVVQNVTEYHWKVAVSWRVLVYVGNLDDWSEVLQERASSVRIITLRGKDQPPIAPSSTHEPFEVSLSWLLNQVDTEALTAQFAIDVEDDEHTRTPRQNRQVEDAIQFWNEMSYWSEMCDRFFSDHVQRDILNEHNPAIPSPPSNEKKLSDITKQGIFCPIQPLMDDSESRSENAEAERADGSQEVEKKSLLAFPANPPSTNDSSNPTTSPLLSSSDMCMLLNEHVRSLEQKMSTISKHFPAKQLVKLISVSEADLVMLCRHTTDLKTALVNGVGYIEEMLKTQLKAAIGKVVQAEDLDKFMRYHNSKLLRVPPHPFCHAIRRPEHFPDGVLSIESADGNDNDNDNGGNVPIETLVRKVQSTQPLEVPLNAAVTLELTGPRYLHGWMQHRFEYSHKSYHLAARARQFSSFVLLVGNMTGPDSISPKDAIILQNKDEVIIPLLLEELPSHKEFKDAIQSLSPEQQRFAKSFRNMQLESSVLGVCIIQVKPQLEALLGLPNDSLTKEMKLTQDLTELFVEYQVPSDLLSYDGSSGSDGELVGSTSMKEKVASVKSHVKAVLDVIEEEKTKQLDQQKMKADMAKSQHQELYPESGRSEAPHGSFLFGGQGLSQQSGPMQGFGGGLYGAPIAAAPGSLFGGQGLSQQQQSGRMQGYGGGGSYGAPAAAAPEMMLASASMSVPSGKILERRVMNPERAIMKSATVERAAAVQAEECEDSGDYDDDDDDGSYDEVEMAEDDNEQSQLGKDTKEETVVKSDQTSTDFTLIPKILDTIMGEHDKDNAIRSTVIKTKRNWSRQRQANLLTKAKLKNLSLVDIRNEKNKAFDLLDALSRSGSLPIACSELHVVISVTHGFENDVMGTVIQDNVNPIEKLEKSMLLMASTVYGVPPRDLVKGSSNLSRLSGLFPALLKNEATDDAAIEGA